MLTPSILDGKELAEALDVPYAKVMDWARDGTIPSIRSGGRYWFNAGHVVKAIRANHHKQAVAGTGAEDAA